MPYPRFKEVNEARKRFEEQAQKLAWAQAIPDTAAPTITEFYQSFTRDPIGTLIREVEGIAQSDPAHAQAVRSAAARWLGAGRGQQQAAAEPMPEPDLQAQDGTLVYSAAQGQKLREWDRRQLMAQVSQQMQPLQQFAAKQQADAMRAEIKANADSWAQSTYAQWKQKPHFEDHKQQIAQLMQANPQMGVADAYAEVLVTQVLPKLSATERSSVVAAMQSKAAAGTMDPSRGPAQGPPKFKGFGDAYLHLAGQPG